MAGVGKAVWTGIFTETGDGDKRMLTNRLPNLDHQIREDQV